MIVSKNSVFLKDLKLKEKYFKKIMVIFLIIFLIFTVYESRAIEKIEDQGIIIKNPIIQAKKFPKSLEGLGEKSVIFDDRGRKALEYNAIAFNFIVDDESKTIKNLKKIFQSDYDVYTFKKYYTTTDPTSYYKMLESQHGIILKDFSKSFCKMINTNVTMNSENNPKGDSVCYQNNIDN